MRLTLSKTCHAVSKSALQRRAVVALLGLLVPFATESRPLVPYTFDNEHQWIASADDYAPWIELMSQHREEQSLFEACLEQPRACPPYLKGYRRIVKRAHSLSAYGKLQAVNRFINDRRWITDRRRTGMKNGEAWVTLKTFLDEGGDCEDFAIAKYFMLRHMGMSADEIRIVVSWDRRVREHHAVVAVNIQGRAVIMETDNTIRRHGRDQREYRFMFSINETGIWDHTVADGS